MHTETYAAATIDADGLSEAAADRYFARLAAGAPPDASDAATPAASVAQAPPRRGLQPVAARRDTADAAKTSGLPRGIRYREEILRAAAAHGLDPVLLAAVAAQETGGPGAHSGRNVRGADGTGRGVFQIDSGTWGPWLATHHDGMRVDENADKAASILADNLRATGGDVPRALHRYNAGSDGVPCTRTTWGDGRTLSYESSVLRHAAQIRALPG